MSSADGMMRDEARRAALARVFRARTTTDMPDEVFEFERALREEGYYVAPLTTEGGPTARTSDPRTSKAWSPEKMGSSSQAYYLLAAFGEFPTDGLTDEEAMYATDGKVKPTSEFAKRCSDLRSAGLIVDTGFDRKGGSGLDRIVSRITDKGSAVLERLASR